MKLETDVDIDQIFQQAFTTAGSPNIECQCGREHVAVDSYCWDDPESNEVLNSILERAKEEDHIVLHHGCDHLSVIDISGMIFAEDCECEGWAPYRNFIFQNRRHVKDFLVNLAKEAKIAYEMEQTFDILSDKELMKHVDEPLF